LPYTVPLCAISVDSAGTPAGDSVGSAGQPTAGEEVERRHLIRRRDVQVHIRAAAGRRSGALERDHCEHIAGDRTRGGLADVTGGSGRGPVTGSNQPDVAADTCIEWRVERDGTEVVSDFGAGVCEHAAGLGPRRAAGLASEQGNLPVAAGNARAGE
jgi:hypothetical protein